MIVYVIGVPGVGKSTACARAVARWEQEDRPDAPVPHRAFYHQGRLKCLALGGDHPKHPGTDRLSMGIMPTACEWIAETPPGVPVLGEGDRLASEKFWGAAEAAGHRVIVALLTLDSRQLAARRAGRNQNPRWLTGRATRVANIAAQRPCVTIEADHFAPGRIRRLLEDY